MKLLTLAMIGAILITGVTASGYAIESAPSAVYSSSSSAEPAADTAADDDAGEAQRRGMQAELDRMRAESLATRMQQR